MHDGSKEKQSGYLTFLNFYLYHYIVEHFYKTCTWYDLWANGWKKGRARESGSSRILLKLTRRICVWSRLHVQFVTTSLTFLVQLWKKCSKFSDQNHASSQTSSHLALSLYICNIYMGLPVNNILQFARNLFERNNLPPSRLISRHVPNEPDIPRNNGNGTKAAMLA